MFYSFVFKHRLFLFHLLQRGGRITPRPTQTGMSIGKLREGESWVPAGRKTEGSPPAPAWDPSPPPLQRLSTANCGLGNLRSVTKAQEIQKMSIETCFHKLLEQNKILKKKIVSSKL